MVLTHQGYSVWITCGGSRLEEFAITEEDETTISCYICSEIGKAFQVEFSEIPERMRQKLDKAVNVYADGQLVRGKCSDYGEGGKISSARVSPAELRGFQFQETMITDDDSLLSGHHEDLGCIEIRVRRILSRTKNVDLPSSSRHKRIVPVTAIHERSKKLGSHSVGLGSSVLSEHRRSRCEYYDDTPCSKFRFYYRKREILQAQGIITASSSPSQGTASRPRKRQREMEDEGDLIVPERRQAELRAEQESISKKISKKKVKLERMKDEQIPALSSNDIIDLT